MNGLSLDFIIHPGETVKEVLEKNNMNQEELAIRTGFSAKHVSQVVNGIKGISPCFAKSLEYVFNMPSSFWINLQANYDKEIENYKDQNSIEDNEIKIVKDNKKIINYAKKIGLINNINSSEGLVIETRKLCGVKDLFFIDILQEKKAIAYRKSEKVATDNYALYIWLRICEKLAKKTVITEEYNEEKLVESIEKIKKCMFLEINQSISELKRIFAECGIVFQLVENFKGVPVQGFIDRIENKLILTMTIRGSSADIFWFTLFHEIGHLLNGDMTKNNNFIDFNTNISEGEEKADNYAKNILIDKEDFKNFYKNEKFSDQSIINFARKENIPPFIVAGRLNKETNNYKIGARLKVKYKWE